MRSLSTFAVENASVLSAGLNIAAAVAGVDTSPEKSIYVELILRFPSFIILTPFELIRSLSLLYAQITKSLPSEPILLYAAPPVPEA